MIYLRVNKQALAEWVAARKRVQRERGKGVQISEEIVCELVAHCIEVVEEQP